MQKDMRNRKNIFAILVFLAGLCFWGAGAPAFAQGEELGFQKDDSYDIYYYAGGDNISLIKNVEILKVVSIHNADFLVVQGAGFKVQNEPGYIRFDSIRAILPHNFYRVMSPVE